MIRKSIFRIAILTFLMSVVISACGGSTGVNATATALNGRALLEQRCTECHTLDRVERASMSPERWGLVVRRMVSKGSELNASEQQILIEYLSSTYP